MEAERTDKKQTKKENIGQIINVIAKRKARLVYRECLEQGIYVSVSNKVVRKVYMR